VDCDETQAALLDYHAGQLDLPRQTRLEAHLLVCDRCLTALHELETLLTLVAEARAPAPSPGALQRVRARIAAERRRTRARQARWAWAGLASATAAVLVLAVAGTSTLRWSGPDVSARVALPARIDLERSIASMALDLEGSSLNAALGLWRAPLLEQEALDVFAGLIELPESEVDELLARLRG
jgi:anti-sigma factor ChrR (cupin superfamily)